MTYTDSEIFNYLTETYRVMDELKQRFQSEFAIIETAEVGQQKRVLIAFGLYRIAEAMLKQLQSGDPLSSLDDDTQSNEREADLGLFSDRNLDIAARNLFVLQAGQTNNSENSEQVIESSFQEVTGKTLDLVALLLKEVQFNLPADAG